MNVWNEKPLIRSSDIGLIGYKILNIRSVCVIFYSGNLRPNSPTHKSMKRAVLLQRQSFFVALLFYLCYNEYAIKKDKRITFLSTGLQPLSSTQGRGTGSVFLFNIQNRPDLLLRCIKKTCRTFSPENLPQQRL